MAEDKNGFRRHVRAAKEWLGETESSLEKDEAIKGDLNFMLAQAELERAREVKEPSPPLRLLPQLAAFLLACLLAGGWWLWQRQPEAQEPEGRAAPAAAAPAPDTEQKKAAEGLAGEAIPRAEGKPGTEEEPAEEPAVREVAEEPVAEGAGEAVQGRQRAELTGSAPSLPDEELQRLMNEAGRSLRAQ